MKILVTISILLLSVVGYGKKYVKPIEVVICSADLIVKGEVIEVNDNSYRIKTIRTLKGNISGTLKIKKFKEWTCDTRAFDLKKGTQVILFLEKELDSWKPINGSTGEMPISDSKVRLKYYRDPSATEGYLPYVIDASRFENAIAKFAQCFTLKSKVNMNNPIGKYKLTCADHGSSETNSDFYNWLLSEIRNNGEIEK